MAEESSAVPERGLGAAGPVIPLLQLFSEKQKVSPAALSMTTTFIITHHGGGCFLLNEWRSC